MQEDFAVAAGIPSFLRSSVILQTFGRTDGHVCQANNHIHIPPFVQPPNMANYSSWRPDLQRRDIWAYFRGKMEINPKNVSGRIYSRYSLWSYQIMIDFHPAFLCQCSLSSSHYFYVYGSLNLISLFLHIWCRMKPVIAVFCQIFTVFVHNLARFLFQIRIFSVYMTG